MDGLDLPEIYRRRSGQTHTASDGQKFEVTTDSLEANRSYKYFGKGQGVSAYTFVSAVPGDGCRRRDRHQQSSSSPPPSG
jgi:Tn3 transposase DDE domain